MIFLLIKRNPLGIIACSVSKLNGLFYCLRRYMCIKEKFTREYPRKVPHEKLDYSSFYLNLKLLEVL
ncbi:UNVERIFIED_CONTAM: hypothetical protein ABID98_002319 [Brevibacillus sp. OAP136]